MDDGIAASARLIGEIRSGAFAAPATRRRRPIVIVIGSEESGASLCARVLSVLGIRMMQRATVEPGTPRSPGNGAGDVRGQSKLAGLHDRILGLFSTREDLELPVSWWADPRVAGIRREIADFVNDRIGAGPFGFYDPRAMRLMPVWNQIAKELKLAPKIVHSLRNPAQLARVLQARDGVPPALAEYRWFAHTTEFFRHARKAEICTIDYDEWFVDSAANLQKLQRFLALPDEPAAPDVEAAVSAMIEQERPGSDIGAGEARQPLIRSVYRLARRAEHDAGARDQLQHIAGQLLSFQQLHAVSRAPAEVTPAGDAEMPGKGARAARGVSALQLCLSPASFWQPDDIVPSAWHQHAPFAFWLTEALRPGIFVELGAHNGFSYLAFCQAVQRLGGRTKCYAIDTWKGDEHAGFYGEEVFATVNELHDRRYSGFSRLIRSTFDEALPHFGEGTVDLLHIDGRHRYEDVAHDFESWLPKLSDRAVVLLHDINVRERGFGVWRFWADLQARYRCFEFAHGYGLGVVQVGREMAEPLRPLFESAAPDKAAIAQTYAQLGLVATASHDLAEARTALREREARIAVLERDGAAVRDALGQAEGWVRDREATIEFLRADIRRLQETAAAASLREEELQRLHDRRAGAREEELQRLHDQLAGAREEELQRLHDQLAGAREEELGRIRTQLAGLREAVRQFEREAEQRSAGDAAMRREIAVALEAVRRSSEAAAQDAAREAQQSAAALENMERRASEAERKVAALSGEIEGLKTELADSRQVGRAALHALAVSNRGYAYREPRLGWRQTLQRLFAAIRGQ
jgi:hypothetical protein